jgi:SPP1 gp7 family putative phage head morphogenesis protein
VNQETIRAQMDFLEIAIRETLQDVGLGVVVDQAGRQVDKSVQRNIKRLIPINFRTTPEAQQLLDAWREANVNLIETGTSDMAPRLRPSLLRDVSDLVEQAHNSGLRVEALAGELIERFQVSNSRAELIARDQVLKLNSQISRHRQQAAGVTQYQWVAVRDSRTRKRHQQLHGTIHSWANPPEVAPGRYEHPGGDYQCRCRARPILPE